MLDFDTAIIGSGSGGLTSALALARAGQRVAVFEQHTHPGGYSQSFKRQGYQFSPGVHYIGKLGPGGRLREIYEGLGVSEDLVFLEINPDGYDRVFVGEERFDIPKGWDRYRERLQHRFPAESKGIGGYFDAIRNMTEELGWARPPHSLSDAIALPFRVPNLLRLGRMPLDRLLDRFVDDPLLRAILSIQVGDHGMAPSRAPAALHAGLQSYYFDGACYPHGGAHRIPEALVKGIKAHGGELHFGAEIDEIVFEGGRASGLRLGSGETVRANQVIANTDPGVTWGRLVDESMQSRRLKRRIKNTRYSLSTLSLFLAVDMDLAEAGFDSGNIWYSRTTDVEAGYRVARSTDWTQVQSIPSLFLNITTLKDPSLRSDGIHTLEVMAVSGARGFEKWRDGRPGRRGPEYAALKEHLSQVMLAEIDRFIPGLSQNVVYRALGTPLSNMHYIRSTEGGMYGTEKTLGNLGPFSFPVRTHLPGLFQCGASTFAPGVYGVTASGLAAAAAILGCEEDALLDADGPPLRVYASDDPLSWPEAIRPAA